MSEFLFHKKVESYTAISRFGVFIGEQYEIVVHTEGDCPEDKRKVHFNFRHPDAPRLSNHYNKKGDIELFAPPDQYLGTIDLLRNEKPVWVTIKDAPLRGWLITEAEPIGVGDEDADS